MKVIGGYEGALKSNDDLSLKFTVTEIPSSTAKYWFIDSNKF